MNTTRKEFEEFLQKAFPAAYAVKHKHGTSTWVDFAFSCYCEGIKSANVKALDLINFLEEKTK